MQVGGGISIAPSAGIGAKTFTELAAWQRADELRQFVLEITARPLVARDFRFCDQCKAAARSAPNNIAEGFGRYHHKEFAQFVRVAMGSIQEVRDQMFEAHQLHYISEAELLGVETTIKRAVASCAGLERYLRSTTCSAIAQHLSTAHLSTQALKHSSTQAPKHLST